MKTKFEEFLKESILPEPIQMDYNEDDRVRMGSTEIEIDDKFENELTLREALELKNWSSNKSFNDKELIKLNLYFGNYIPKLHDSSEYIFKTKYGTFGQPITTLNGKICKRIEFGKSPSEYKDNYYLIDMFMTVKVGSNKGNRHVYLKFNTLNDVIDFFKTFER